MNAKVGVSLLLAILCLVACSTLQGGARADFERVRQAAVAGSFYPSDPKELAAMVDGFVAQAKVPALKADIVALVSPHAGYPFSGAVAGHSYALLKGRPTHRVVVIAPSHFEAFSFTSVYDGDAYATPLGKVAVDKEFVRRLVKLDRESRLSSSGHVPTAAGPEHALEDQLPFLQRVLGDFQLVPIIMGEQSYEASRALGVALAELIRGTDTLIVVSSDLSHYHPYDQAVSIDGKTLSAIKEWDYLAMSDNFAMRTWEACGGAPIVAAMIAAERLGATQAQLIKYANSGDVTGDRTRVVGYSSVAFLKEEGSRQKEVGKFTLTSSEKRQLLEIARKSVESAVRENKVYTLPANLPASLRQDRAAFVTLKENGRLRGCIGQTVAMQSLAETVRDVAALAALRDPRFRSVTPSELSMLTYEISVLSSLRHVANTNRIKIGEHGLMIVKAGSRGILLPQVATEQHWDRTTLLDETALKAGLPAKAWQDNDADLFLFTAVVFGETETSRELMPNEIPPWPNRHARPGEPVPGSPPQ
ncbi:MAG TPA: AmmeMemoRadiSam system protein B [Terriglobales bacterium]|nr:AmmeMemoRadiSam system protein B [Terriglobales bacterium]